MNVPESASAVSRMRPPALWHRYQTLGVTSDLPAPEIRCVVALNGMIPIVTVMLWLQIPLIVKLLPDTRYILASFLLWPLLWQVVPLLNSWKLYDLARLYFSLSSLILIAFNAVQLGPATENHLFMMSVFLTAFVIYPPRSRRWLLFVVALSLVALAGLEWFYQNRGGLLAFPPEFVNVTRWSSMSALVMILLAVAAYHYHVTAEAERKLELEYQRSERLLLNILPSSIAERLKRRERPLADRFEDASILFADLVGFTELASRIPHERVVQILDELFSEFDRIGRRHGLEKLKTIGDAYMLAGGIPDRAGGHHAAIASCALELLRHIRSAPIEEAPRLGIRIGIHCGPVVAGVICETKFAYDIWGDAVNVASRMESHGLPNQIQVSRDFYSRTREMFRYRARGPIPIKGKGSMEVYLLEG